MKIKVPIPRLAKGEIWESEEIMYEAYRAFPFNWVKVLDYVRVVYDPRRGGVIYAVDMRVEADKLPSCSCGNSGMQLVNMQRSGVYLTCAHHQCRRTTGPVSIQAQTELSRKRISLLEAKTISEHQGVRLPIGLDDRIKAIRSIAEIRSE